MYSVMHSVVVYFTLLVNDANSITLLFFVIASRTTLKRCLFSFKEEETFYQISERILVVSSFYNLFIPIVKGLFVFKITSLMLPKI